MLAEQAADKLTMDGLAERADLGKGTVFRRFRTRAGIFQAPRHRTASSPTAGPASTS
ncbi:helix-turn-helix domain-containing protein [Streptomyces prunicolor]|uniref:helix-turn-helix domain-containing protein n=1 Tax=Streptomyces prunicolor TaxID=67348 RepID=UPI0037D14865